jgi:hypothetical protein
MIKRAHVEERGKPLHPLHSLHTLRGRRPAARGLLPPLRDHLAGASATTALGLFGGTSVTQAKAPMMNTNYRKRLRRLGAGLRHGGNSEVARQT